MCPMGHRRGVSATSRQQPAPRFHRILAVGQMAGQCAGTGARTVAKTQTAAPARRSVICCVLSYCIRAWWCGGIVLFASRCLRPSCFTPRSFLVSVVLVLDLFDVPDVSLLIVKQTMNSC